MKKQFQIIQNNLHFLKVKIKLKSYYIKEISSNQETEFYINTSEIQLELSELLFEKT